MNNPKLHHFVARSYQERFCTPDGGIFIYDKLRPELGVRLSTPTTEFAETHLYSVIADNGVKNPSHETNFFSKLDNDFGLLTDKIIAKVRNGKNPGFTPAEKAFWDKFIFYQWRRLPQVMNKTSAIKNLEKDLPGYIKNYELKYGPISDEEKARISESVSIKRLAQNAVMEVITGNPSEEILRILGSKGVAIAHIRKTSKSFVLGSLPFIRMGPPNNSHLSDPLVELWLPLSHDIAVSPAYSQGTETIIPLSDEQIRRVNAAIFQQSDKIGARSDALLRSLISNR